MDGTKLPPDDRELRLADYGWAGVFVLALAALGFLLGA
jgi:hypothetical protein